MFLSYSNVLCFLCHEGRGSELSIYVSWSAVEL